MSGSRLSELKKMSKQDCLVPHVEEDRHAMQERLDEMLGNNDCICATMVLCTLGISTVHLAVAIYS